MYPTLSRRGGRLAYMRDPVRANIWRIPGPSAANEPRIPTRFIESSAHDLFPSYSPDGKSISFISTRTGNHEVWICDNEARNARQLTFLKPPITLASVWSPDGKQIAFYSSKEGSYDIYTIGSMGGVPTRITTETSHETTPSWSRDGRWIYFASDRSGALEVWKKPVAGGKAIRVTQSGGGPAFESDDARFLYFATSYLSGQGSPGLWRIPANGGKEERVLENVRFLERTLTGRSICYINLRTGLGPAIETFDIATGKVTRLAVLEHIPSSWRLSVSPDGRWILYDVAESAGSDIMLVENFR